MNQENPSSPTASPPSAPSQAPLSGLAIGALICGILALILIPTVFGAPIPALIAIILALIHLLSKSRTRGRGLSVAGLLCSLLALAAASVLGYWAFNKGKQAVENVTQITSTVSGITGGSGITNATAILNQIENLPVDNEEAANIAENLNTDIPSLEGLDISGLLGALTNPGDPSAMSNLNSIVDSINSDQTRKELEELGLEGIGTTIENLGSQFKAYEELNELLAE